TYAELDTLANQLAHQLILRGAARGNPIGLYVDRSLAMIVGIIGILKAGCCYVPLDPTYPPDRIDYILVDTQTPLVVTQPHLSSQLNFPEKSLLALDDEWALISNEPKISDKNYVDESDLAYIIYTSGSTGKPKGVMVTHGNLFYSTAARLQYYNEIVGSFLLLSSFSFDSSIAGIFWTLCSGGKLVLPPTRIEQDMNQLAKTIADQEVTHTLCLPSLYMLILDLADNSRLSSLKTVIVAGEASQPELVSRHYSTLPQTKLYNEYGPTETSVWSTVYKIPTNHDRDKVPIGRPIPNVRNYILDPNQRPVPIGVPGELCIGGVGVSRGYLNSSELTNKKFIQSSIPGVPHGRLYHTGDRARYLPDGNIEFLGRIDHQIKIRGNRVELGEIESILRRMPGVKDAVVISRKDRLIAYVITDPEHSLLTDWRSYLIDHLPDYMIPSDLIALEAFPLSPNGKLDREALPIPDSDKSNDVYTAPTTSTEKALADIWEEILGIDQVGIHDNFFELGGDSLISIRVFARIADQFDVNLPLSVLFTETTIEQLAARILKEKDDSEPLSLLVPIQPKGYKLPFFCIHGITGDVLWFRNLGQLMAPDQPFYGIQARGLDGIEPANDTIPQMATSYLEELKKVQPVGPYFLGGASLGGTVALEMAQQLQQHGEEVALLIMFDHPPNYIKNDKGKLLQLIPGSIQIMRNLPNWASAIRDLGWKAVFQRIQRKVRVGKKLLNGRSEDKLDSVDAADILDYGNQLPEFRQRMIEAHWHAINNYLASQYDKPVLLLQSKSQPLLSTERPEAAWEYLATGDLTVINIPGSHEGMFKEPHVHTLAHELMTQLNLVQSAMREE
ncbi:MAG: amino acid adenylation domain-containing protein, partial [Chloroflexota bacterium]